MRYALPALYRVIWSIRPRVVISTLGHMNLALLASRWLLPSGTRLIVREANTPSARAKHTTHPRFYRMGFRMLYPRADRVLCNAAFMKEDLTRSFSLPRHKISVACNPVDVEGIRNRAAAEDPYNKGGIQLISVGRLNCQKGYDLLLHVLKDACSQIPDLHLTLVGDGPEEQALKSLAKELGVNNAVTFAGYQENPYPYMACADLFISPSRYEGSPNSVLESLACGTPVLAFDCPGGTREIISEAKNGWLVPAGDTGAMAERLIQIVRNSAWESLNSARLLPAAHECRNAVRGYESLLLECAGEK